MSARIFLIALLSIFSAKQLVRACDTDWDCNDSDEVCCNGICQYQYDYCSCYGSYSCPVNQYCCDGSCSYDENCGYLDTGAIVGIIIGSIFFVIIVVMVVLCICGCVCAAGPFRNRGRRGYVAGPTYGTTTVVSTTSTGQATNPVQYPPYSGQYQPQPGQYYPQPGQYPPPQYDQNVSSGYQAFPQSQVPPPYSGQALGGQPPLSSENMQKQPDVYAPPAQNPYA